MEGQGQGQIEWVAGVNYFPPPDGKAWPHCSKWGKPEWSAWLRCKGWDEAAIERYWFERYQFGLGLEVKKRATYIHLPTPVQIEAHRHPAPNLLIGGAAGGSKSKWLRSDAYLRGSRMPGFKGILFRRTLTELRDNHIDDIRKDAEVMKPARWDYQETDKVLHFGNGGWLRMAHCENEGDEEKYLSSEYDWIGLDELATFTEKQAIGIMSRARSTKEGVTAMVRAGTNPGGVHTLWVVDRFIERSVDPERDPYYVPEDYGFVPAKLWDNPYLMDADGTFTRYVRRLGAFSPERRRQMLDGDWGAIAGQFFPEWMPTKAGRPWHVQRIEIGKPADLRWFCSLDWGSTSPGCCLWWVGLPDGRFYIAQEYKFNGGAERKTIKDVAGEIKRISTQTLRLKRQPLVYCDPALKQRTGQIGEAYIDTFRRHGVPMEPSSNNRPHGWQRIRELLQPHPDGEGPWLMVDPSCRYLIRTLPAAVSSKADPEDVDTEGDDHALDTLRYGAMSWPFAGARSTRGAMPYMSMGWLKQQAEQVSTGLLARRSA